MSEQSPTGILMTTARLTDTQTNDLQAWLKRHGPLAADTGTISIQTSDGATIQATWKPL